MFVLLLVGLVVGIVNLYKDFKKASEANELKPGEFQAPTSDSGENIRVVMGTRMIKGAYIAGYGNVTTTAIRKKGGKK